MIAILALHSLVRWLVILTLALSLILAWRGYLKNTGFNPAMNKLRHWTATVAHIQLIIGMFLAFRSAYFTQFWRGTNTHFDFSFYGLVHPGLMMLAITILTIGSAKTKRAIGDRQKFKTMIIWFTLSAVIIVIAVPWPFSPLSARPFIRLYH
jgi:hypothetical protein